MKRLRLTWQGHRGRHQKLHSLARIIHEARELGRARLPTPQDDSSALPQRLKPELTPGPTARLKAVPFPILSKLVMNNPG